MLAQEEAERLNHGYIGTEHLLVGLAREREGVAHQVLAELGARPDRIREAVEGQVGRGESRPLSPLTLTPRSKRVLELGVDEARRMERRQVDTEHLLLGLVREGQGVAVDILKSMGIAPAASGPACCKGRRRPRRSAPNRAAGARPRRR